MNTSFQREHLAMLLKYAGISFISGAVNHGFFSGERSLWTAAAGIVMFVAGGWMAHRMSGDKDHAGLARTLAWGTLLSIGLGFFTGGLQHFPDSPARSSWVVPLGFALSVVALAASEQRAWRRGVAVYGVAGLLVVGAASVAAWQALNETRPAVAEAAMQAQVVSRVVEIRMDDTMRFSPSTLQARAGETLRIVARNEGKLEHELVIGDDAQIAEHATAMQSGAAHAHGAGGGLAAVRVAPGQAGELVVTFTREATLQLACLVPGHYEAGMRGSLVVAQGPAGADAPAHTAPPEPGHSGHRH
ncbi:cupredoxin domain-containing protein [Caenimonas aquaedulcis]|uniref:Blue (type 1) copper domain-containing protein n=1 Tax=Caenimonas aquaedulcis TaxID=2793270 RepID=A0A931H6J6_9BURK|nr:plastocyanin/azurin family copper-binding protein [Caenimonas aquaedulcis]MBG9389382.1 hypothetical protein [Caenimonas aquaedulcis]